MELGKMSARIKQYNEVQDLLHVSEFLCPLVQVNILTG